MNKAVKLFLRGLTKSLICLLFLIGVGVLSYKVVIYFIHIPEEEAVVAFDTTSVREPITEASVDDISKNLIFAVDEETGHITKLILEILHCEGRKLYYITIPIQTQFTMSDTLYQKLILEDPAIPQLIKLSGITNYFPVDTVYDYGVLLVEDLLGIKLSYYTAIHKSIYENIFITEETPIGETLLEAGEFPREVLSADYIELTKTITTQEKLKSYIEELYPLITSNLALADKMNYLDSYSSLTRNNIYFELIAGEDTNSAFVVDIAVAAKHLKDIITN